MLSSNFLLRAGWLSALKTGIFGLSSNQLNPKMLGTTTAQLTEAGKWPTQMSCMELKVSPAGLGTLLVIFPHQHRLTFRGFCQRSSGGTPINRIHATRQMAAGQKLDSRFSQNLNQGPTEVHPKVNP